MNTNLNKIFSTRTLAILGAIAFALSSCTRIDAIQKFELGELSVALPSKLDIQKISNQANTRPEQASLLNRETGKIETSIQQCVFQALANNSSFKVNRLRPKLQATQVEIQTAAFEPTLSASLTSTQASDEDTDTAAADTTSDGDSFSTGITLTQKFPTGTSLSIFGQHTSGSSDGTSGNSSSASNSLDITLTQSLLRGAGKRVNLISLQQAKIDMQISQHLLRDAAAHLVYQTEIASWNYILAEQQIAIYADSLKLAENQLAEVKERIKVGVLADVELAAMRAELAGRREDYINAKSNLDITRIEFYRTSGIANWTEWDVPLTITDTPKVPEDIMATLNSHIMLALKQRADLNEARLQKASGELDVVRTKNGLLPKLDFFVSVDDRSGEGQTSTGDTTSETQNIELGLSFEYALSGREKRATHTRALLNQQQLEDALRNQEELAIQEIYTAYLEIKRSAEQLEATRATLHHREEAHKAELEKFRVGKSTSLLVAQAQRDFVASRIAAVEALIQHLKARLTLYYQEGSLLERRGIAVYSKTK